MPNESENQDKLALVRQLLESAQASLLSAKQILAELGVGAAVSMSPSITERARRFGSMEVRPGEKVIEGVFNGQNMVGPDGKLYSVPANYASKSKLVEGDRLKLTITQDGTFIYKQIGPVERTRLVGILTRDEESDHYYVTAGGRPYRVLLASVTYFKGEPGDEVVILVPKDREAKWGAVENIIKKLGIEAQTPAAVEGEAATQPVEEIQ